jgi:hypothetical protein
MFNLTDNDPLINEVITLMEKMSPEDRQVVLNYVRWFFSEQQALAGQASVPPAGYPPLADEGGGFEEERTVG